MYPISDITIIYLLISSCKKGAKIMSTFYFQDKNAPTPNKPNHIGVNALLVQGDSLLLEKRSDCGQWGLIGGGVKLTETLEQALVREVHEETGILIENFNFFMNFSNPSRIVSHPDGNILRIISIVYTANLREKVKPIASNESTKIQYFTKKEIQKLPIVPTHIEIIETYYHTKRSAHE